MADSIEVELIRDNSNTNSFGTYLSEGEKLTLVVAGKPVVTVQGDGRIEVAALWWFTGEQPTSGLHSPED